MIHFAKFAMGAIILSSILSGSYALANDTCEGLLTHKSRSITREFRAEDLGRVVYRQEFERAQRRFVVIRQKRSGVPRSRRYKTNSKDENRHYRLLLVLENTATKSIVWSLEVPGDQNVSFATLDPTDSNVVFVAKNVEVLASGDGSIDPRFESKKEVLRIYPVENKTDIFVQDLFTGHFRITKLAFENGRLVATDEYGRNAEIPF